MSFSTDPSDFDRRTLLKYGLGVVGVAAGSGLLGACSSSGPATKAAATTTSPPTTTGSGITDSKLLSTARAEGKLVTVAVGEKGSYYVPVIDAFEKYSGIEVDPVNPTYLPTLVLADLEASDGKKPPYDVVEMTEATASEAADKKLLEPYVSTQWRDIPSVFRDPDGAWSASYFGLVSFITNTAFTGGFAPTSWDELLNSSKTPKGSFAMLGDPRTGQPLQGGLALLTVVSAAIANNGSVDDVEPGLVLLGELADKGIFDVKSATGLIALPNDVRVEDTPINALYSFDAPLATATGKANGTPVAANAPSDGLVAGFYPQAIATGTGHLAAAQLWIEFLQSDEGASVFLANGAIPTRHEAIKSSGSKELQDALPPDDELNAPVPSPAQLDAAQKTVDEKWATYLPTSD